MSQAELVADFPVLARLSPGQLAQIAAAARAVRFTAGERVFFERLQATRARLLDLYRSPRVKD